MARTSIYLPDDLAAQVRERGLSISRILQSALRQALDEDPQDDPVLLTLGRIEAKLDGMQTGKA